MAARPTPWRFCAWRVAIAARHAQKQHGLGRVAIVDFDVHHGNGSQDIFWADKTVMYGSTHQMPLYPGTGAKGERGEHNTVVNAPLRAGDGGDKFRAALDSSILPRLRDFKPDLMVISAGFDAHRRDPLTDLGLTSGDFADLTAALAELVPPGRRLAFLEGGYDLDALRDSAAAALTALAGDGMHPEAPTGGGPGRDMVTAALVTHERAVERERF